MKLVIEEAVRLMETGEPCVLATVVRTRGMTPQKAGAKQLVRQDGSRLGTLGGGCVEGDVWYIAKQMLKEASGPHFRDYKLDEDIVAKDGLVCGGNMYFYIEPLARQTGFLPIAREIVQAYGDGPALAVATVVSSQDDRSLGQRLLIRQDGSTLGTLGKPALDHQIMEGASELALLGKSKTVTVEDGTEIYIEGFTAPPSVVIMGGGHIGKSVYELAALLGFRVYVVDDRPEFSNKARFPKATEAVVAAFDVALDRIPINFNTFCLIATRGHRYDDMATRAAVNTPARYVGLLGSRRKNLMIFRDLHKQGVSLDRIKEIHAPVGLDIGALTPGELAVSILAEIIMCLRGGSGKSLKMETDNLAELISELPTSDKTPLPF